MALKLVKIENNTLARSVWIAAACLCLFAGWKFANWHVATAIATHLDPQLEQSALIAEWLTAISPADADVQFALAVTLENSFEPGDFEKSLAAYERAVHLSPDNYLMWLGLARARSRSGDIQAAESAFSRALELAPNYSSVQWAYGNFLVRQDQINEGFALIAKAAANPQYAGPAAALALQIFDNDVEQVRTMLGGGEDANVALAPMLAALRRYDDSFNAWDRLPGDLKNTKYEPLGEQLIEQMVGGNQYRHAARITADLAESEASKPVIGQVVNGGFESGVKLRQAGRFEWQITEGDEPQVGLSEAQKHSGRYGLWIVFDTFATADFRQVSQIVAVEPGTHYKLEAFYVSALKTVSKLKLEIINPVNGGVLATTKELTPTNVWLPLTAEFTVPPGVDGIKIQLLREGCNGPACPVNGTLGLDDISLTRP